MGDLFGYASVTPLPPLGDGTFQIAVGACGDSMSQPKSGAVYVLSINGQGSVLSTPIRCEAGAHVHAYACMLSINGQGSVLSTPIRIAHRGS